MIHEYYNTPLSRCAVEILGDGVIKFTFKEIPYGDYAVARYYTKKGYLGRTHLFVVKNGRQIAVVQDVTPEEASHFVTLPETEARQHDRAQWVDIDPYTFEPYPPDHKWWKLGQD